MATSTINALAGIASVIATTQFETDTGGTTSNKATALQIAAYVLLGNAATSTKLAAAITINGVSFDGSSNITVAAAAGTLTGSTLASGVTASSLTGLGAQAQALNLNSHQINNLSDPTSAQDAATKSYVDGIAAGLSPKSSVAVATAAALPTNTYNNGSSGVGATLTGIATGVLTIDGQAVTLGQRVLVKNEVASANNGIYVCSTAGAIGVAYILTRSTDANTSAEIDGAWSFVETGTVNATSGWAVASASTITIGTTAIVFTQIFGPGTVTAGTGITVTGTQVAITNTAVTPGTYGDATHVGQFTVNAQGQITSASSVAITGSGGAVDKLQTYNLSGQNVIQIMSQISSTYKTYFMVFRNLTAAAGSVSIQFSTNNGSSWLTGSSYNYSQFGSSPNSFTNVASIGIGGMDATNPFNMTAYLHNALSAQGTGASFVGHGTEYTGGTLYVQWVGGLYTAGGSINAVQISLSSGNWSTGQIDFYGIT